MLNSKNTKGNKTQDEGIIPFYTKEAFPGTVKEAEDDDVAKGKMVSLKLKIDESKPDTKQNTYSRYIKTINNFHMENKEEPMELLSFLREEVLPNLHFKNDYDKINTLFQYMNTACLGQAARQWRQCKVDARRDIIKPYVYPNCSENNSYFIEDENQEDIIIGTKFTDWLDERKAAGATELAYMEANSGDELWKYLVESYYFRVLDHMNKLIFGEDAHKALDDQIEYLKNKIIKPFGVGVRESFERIDTLLSYLKLFPPTTKKDEFPTLEAHKEHMNFKIAARIKRDIFLHLLPEEQFQLKYTTDCEKHYTLMSKDEFINAAIRFEKADKVMREQKEKLKKSNEKRSSDSTSSLSRSDKSKNQSSKKRARSETKQKNAKGEALFCVFCHENGAPKWVYTNHDEESCRKLKKSEDEKKLSGGSRNRYSYQQTAKREMKAMKKKYIKLKKATKELRMIQSLKNQKKKSKKSDYSSDESVLSEDSDLFGDSD